MGQFKVLLSYQRAFVLIARDTWLSRIGEKVKVSHFSSISANVFAWRSTAGLTARSFLTGTAMSLTASGFSKVAAGGDMSDNYLRGSWSLQTVKFVLSQKE